MTKTAADAAGRHAHHSSHRDRSRMSDMKTCFKRVDYDLSNLLRYFDIGDIGLPDIQR